MSYFPLFPGLPKSEEPHSRPTVSQGLWLLLPVRTQVEMLMRGLDSCVDPALPPGVSGRWWSGWTCPSCSPHTRRRGYPWASCHGPQMLLVLWR